MRKTGTGRFAAPHNGWQNLRSAAVQNCSRETLCIEGALASMLPLLYGKPAPTFESRQGETVREILYQ
jgi:hypothetical protein